MNVLNIVSIGILQAIIFSTPVIADSTLTAGYYIRLDDLSDLKNKHSAYEVFSKNELVAIDVATSSNNTILSFTWNFHEGDIDRVLDSNGNLHRIDNEIDSEKFIINIIKPDLFVITSPPKHIGKFKLVKSFQDTLRKYSISGKYIDSNNKIYTFTTDGLAYFPDNSYKYEIGVDHTFDKYDYIDIGNARYGFKIENNNLNLYRIIETNTAFSKLESTPFLILKRAQNYL